MGAATALHTLDWAAIGAWLPRLPADTWAWAALVALAIVAILWVFR